MEPKKSKISLPKRYWLKATCTVCGQTFDYSGQRKPAVCRNGDCRYKYQYKIEPSKWANFQPTLFNWS